MAFEAIKDNIIEANTIDNKFYSELNVKRGLRNEDGSGVLAGLSRISSVVGVSVNNGTRTPVDGVLKYRGQEVRDIVKATKGMDQFEYVLFLLLTGKEPNKSDMEELQGYLSQQRFLSREVVDHLIRALPSKNIMNKLQTVVSALYTLDSEPETIDPFENFLKSLKITAKLPVIVAYSYLLAYETNPTLVVPEPTMNTAESLLYMLREGQRPTEFEVDILDLSFDFKEF